MYIQLSSHSDIDYCYLCSLVIKENGDSHLANYVEALIKVSTCSYVYVIPPFSKLLDCGF